VAGYVFVSYSRHDKHYVDRLVTYLRDHGFDVWYDEKVATAERWRTAIRDRVDGCGVFLIVMSPNSEDSKYVEWEYQRAIDGKRPIVPLLLAGTPFMELNHLKYYRVDNQELPGPDLLDIIRALLPAGAASSRRAFTGTPMWYVPAPAHPAVVTGMGGTHPTGLVVTAFSPRGDTVAIGCGHTVSLMDARNGVPVTVLNRPVEPPLANPLEEWWRGKPPPMFRSVTSLAWLPVGQRLGITWSRGVATYRQVRLLEGVWDVHPVTELGVWDGAGSYVPARHAQSEYWSTTAGWSLTRHNIFVITYDYRSLYVHHLDRTSLETTGLRTIVVPSSSRTIAPVVTAWAPDGQRLAVSYSATAVHHQSRHAPRTVAVWDITTGAQLYTMNSSAGAIAWAPNGRYLAGADGASVRVWYVETGKQIYVLNGHTRAIRTLAYSPDGQYLATGGDDQTVRIWRPNTGEFACMLVGHTAPVTSLSWAPGATALVSGGFDGVRMWRLTSS
jgi:WD40 repeat protein